MKSIHLKGEREEPKNKIKNKCRTKRHHLAKLNIMKTIHVEGEREEQKKGPMSNQETSPCQTY
jgi:hypothetical protein